MFGVHGRNSRRRTPISVLERRTDVGRPSGKRRDADDATVAYAGDDR
jgi:hypothetical protein